MKNILFITWDGSQTNYLDGLFMPIFKIIQDKHPYNFHILQFTWSSKNKKDNTKLLAEKYNIKYNSITIKRNPSIKIGSILTAIKGVNQINKYIKNNKIDIVMPRSTMPAVMVNLIKNGKFKILFDADGLPLQERIDFSGLKENSYQYKYLKYHELKMISQADGVLTRTKKSIDLYSKILNPNKEKFNTVTNGRDVTFFKKNQLERKLIREELNLNENDILFVYCGSLGPQYGWDEMMNIFKFYTLKNSTGKFLILTGNVAYALERIEEDLNDKIIVKNISMNEMPNYLSAADVAFAIRDPKPSMQGVAPIKLGEYLLMELPVIASKRIGDTEALLEKCNGCYLYDTSSNLSLNNSISFIENISKVDKQEIRNFAIDHFSIEKSVQEYVKSLNFL